MLDSKSYVYYDVRPVKRIEIRQYTHRVDGIERYSGTFTVAFRCYNPFGKLFRNSYSGVCGEAELIQTGILPADMMPEPAELTSRQMLLYNCGTERANTRIQLAGDVGEGLTIENITTGQQCKIVGLKAGEIPPGAYLEIDSETGQVWLVKGEERELAFHYHDLGYIQLAPCTPFVRNMKIRHEAGSKQIETDGAFLPHMAGQFIRLDGVWHKIHRVQDAHTAHLVIDAPATGETDTPVVTMSDIWLRGDGINMTKLEVSYTPRVR